MNLEWWKKPRLTVSQLWHLFGTKAPGTDAEINRWEYMDVSTKEANRDEDKAIADWKRKKG